MMCFSAGMYIFNHQEIVKAFSTLGFPTYIIYPLAAAKVMGLIVIWGRFSQFLLGLAYAGFFYNLILAMSAHIMIGDGEFPGALLGLVLVTCSYLTQKKI